MLGNNFIKINVIYAEGQTTVTSGMIKFKDDKFTLLGEDFALIPHRVVVDVVGYRDDGVQFMSGLVSLSTKSQLNFEIIKSDGKKERRMYLKEKVQLNSVLLRAFSKGKSRRSYAVGEKIVIRDLSLGGVGFYSNKVLLKKQKITMDFSGIKPGFTAEAEVLRREKGPFPGDCRFKYGCRFLDVSGEEERVLCEFVLKAQLKNRRKLTEQEEE
ncbi:MAG: PilZ domain-containing protein [Eubacteriales bacterium]|nr:PilZ domain-containing protein [Eubacteriales bacterium]MDD3199271.1 PilZ domain-containing protein [Eubacteriales bacterium]MDD4122058.1 PilZ domain-containing protein [Eubacteriales bacterium]MDD4629401.1 PilZ domain-containing protein [Eubacteriales bacterium]